MLDDLQKNSVQLVVTVINGLAYLQHRLDHRGEHVVRVLDQLADARVEASAADRANQQSIGSERTPNMVLDVDQFALKKLSIGQKCAQLLHLDILHMHGAEPANRIICAIPRASLRSVLLRMADSDTRM